MKNLNLLALVILVCGTLNAQTPWDINGNTIGSTNYIGTINAQPLIFKTNSGERMRLNTNGYLGLGIATVPSSLLHLNSSTTGNLFRTDGSTSLVNQWQLFTNNEKFRLSVPAGSDNVVQNAVNADGSFALETTFCLKFLKTEY